MQSTANDVKTHHSNFNSHCRHHFGEKCTVTVSFMIRDDRSYWSLLTGSTFIIPSLLSQCSLVFIHNSTVNCTLSAHFQQLCKLSLQTKTWQWYYYNWAKFNSLHMSRMQGPRGTRWSSSMWYHSSQTLDVSSGFPSYTVTH